MLAADERKNKGEFLDSLMRVYGDLPICGEVAISKYNYMREREESVDKRIALIDNALSRWASWPAMEELRYARKELTVPLSTAVADKLRVTSKDQEQYC